jgi:hypothetical protein
LVDYHTHVAGVGPAACGSKAILPVTNVSG